LQAPQGLPISAAMSEVLAACVGQDETLQCAIAGNVFDDPCVIYAPLIGVGISWSPVPGATGYEINQIGGGGIVNSFPLPASDLSTNLLPPSAFAPMAGTIENCGFAGYYVTVSAVDACGDRATSVAAVGMF
jgi:hypothetical protein